MIRKNSNVKNHNLNKKLVSHNNIALGFLNIVNIAVNKISMIEDYLYKICIHKMILCSTIIPIHLLITI